MRQVDNCTVVDLFAGAGGLTHGFVREGFHVAAGIEADLSLQHAYEKNNPGAKFVHEKVGGISHQTVASFYPEDHIKILAGCAPCQPFSSYTRISKTHENWALLYEFGKLIRAIQPDIVTMENVPRLKTYASGKVLDDFVRLLRKNQYHVSLESRIYAPNYGVPQHRYRLILIASKYGKVKFLKPSNHPKSYQTVRDAIGHLEPIPAGGVSQEDPVHRTMRLSPVNLQRIRASLPGGTWRDWPKKLRAVCHTKNSGKTYKNVYGRMKWDEPAPTITTQCYGFGNGRFGHPEQNRAISMREAALLQTFPIDYEFFDPSKGEPSISNLALMIGNAVPVALARMIAKSIRLHILEHRGWLHE